MKKILHVSCSPRGTAAESYRLSRKVVECLLCAEPDAVLVSRPIGNGAIAHIDEDYAISQSSLQDVSQKGSMAESEKLIRELENADFVVIGTPMHNFAIPSVLKAWIDHVVRARRTFKISAAGKQGTVRDRPVFVAIASGGRFSGEHARQPDFLTPYLTYVLGVIGLQNLTFFSVQGTAAQSEAVAESRRQAELTVQQHFAGVSPQHGSAALHEQSLEAMPSDAA